MNTEKLKHFAMKIAKDHNRIHAQLAPHVVHFDSSPNTVKN